jgi:hypothetical protein
VKCFPRGQHGSAEQDNILYQESPDIRSRRQRSWGGEDDGSSWAPDGVGANGTSATPTARDSMASHGTWYLLRTRIETSSFRPHGLDRLLVLTGVLSRRAGLLQFAISIQVGGVAVVGHFIAPERRNKVPDDEAPN